MRARPLSAISAVAALAFLALLGTGTHTVSKGETLSGIAHRYGLSASALAQANGIASPDRILVGQRLSIPGAAAATAEHRVARGDTLGSIASRHGTSIAALVEANGLANPNRILVGQVLKVPGASGGSATSTPPPASVAAPAGGATHHVVKRGDTIAGIAHRYGISQRQLIDANGLTNGVVYAGQRLDLLPANTGGAGGAGSTTHKVAAGDTLSSIAQRYGTTVRTLAEANGMADSNLVRIGQTLTVPAHGARPAALCPVQGGAKFMNDWGFPRSGGRFHEGNDLFAARGTPAVAVVSGRVEQKTGRIGGNQVKLFGDDGVSYYYTHLDGFGASGRVAAGDVVGRVGSTGNAAGGPPHVHFEVHPGGGAAVNPYPLFVAVC